MKYIAFFFLTFSLWVHTVHSAQQALAANEVQLTILGTNDLHGALEATTFAAGKRSGGLAFLSGTFQAIRTGLKRNLGNKSGTLIVDAGDQFQGTLISNYSEGQLMIQAMSLAGYDAVVPGNHDFDFGPIGWLTDQSKEPAKRREALERVTTQASFPFLSANTFLKNTLVDELGKSVPVTSKGCRSGENKVIDWTQARQPSIVSPFLIKEIGGVRVAVIGLDLPGTQQVTTADNVEDLCFADEAQTYRRVRKQLQDKADVFVLVLHDGDTNNEHGLAKLVQTLSVPERLVDAVVSGHTHFNYNLKVNAVPIIQSGSGGVNFGRIDLIWNTDAKQINTAKTKSWGGIKLFHSGCDKQAETLCEMTDKGPAYEGVAVTPDASITELINKARNEVAPLANQFVGEALADVKRDRINESALANVMTDLLRTLTGADIAMLNTGGIRDNLPRGKINYEQLFRVFPFSNRTVVMGPMEGERIVALLKRSISTCGSFGALMQSGLRVQYERKCEDRLDAGIDPQAKLLKVETLAGELIYTADASLVNPKRSYHVATVDFIGKGGDGFTPFSGVPLISDLGIMRENFTEFLRVNPGKWTNEIDGRWKNTAAK